MPERPRRLRLAAETPPAPLPPPQPEIAPVSAPPTAPELEQRAKLLAQTGAMLRVVAGVLAIRLQLLLALIGAFVLAIGAMQWQSFAGLYVLVAWCLLAILPLVWLEYSGRPRA